MVNKIPSNSVIVNYNQKECWEDIIELIFIKGKKDKKYRPYKLKPGEEFFAHDILTVDTLFEFLESDKSWLENNIENHGIYHKKKIISLLKELLDDDLINSDW